MNTLSIGAALGVFGLGAAHGINPAMGWLFAVALGMQEKNGRAVWRALPPLALGHALAIAVVVAVAAALGTVVPASALRYGVAAILFVFGVQQLLGGHMHVRYGGMRVGPWRLTMWSFLMASAHGAGLMVLPLVLDGATADTPATHHHAQHLLHAGVTAAPAETAVAAFVHALGYFVMTAAIASIVYHRVGLKLLRTAWVNLNAVWAGALIVTAVLTLLV